MIKYRLRCKKGHEFEGWFSDSAGYEKQAKRGVVTCPDCGSNNVEKALMAPSVSTRRRERESAPQQLSETDAKRLALQKEMLEVMRKVRRQVEENAEYVGPRFAEEARKIHHEESEARGIYGEASLAEAKELVEEGIDILPLPRLPEDAS
jgi:hypothetical protein